MHFFEVNGNKKAKGAQQSNNKSQTKQDVESQIKKIDDEIARLRDSLDIYTTPEEFARIQNQIDELQRQKYLLRAKQQGLA